MKRFIYSLIAVLLLAGVVLLGYLLRPKAEPTPQATNSGQTGGLPNARTGSIMPTTNGTASSSASLPETLGVLRPLIPVPILDFSVAADGTISAIGADGAVIESTQGSVMAITSTTIANLTAASFSPDGKKVLVSFGSADAPQWSVFDGSSKLWSSLGGTNIESAAWAPSGHTVAYLSRNSSGLSLLARDLDAPKSPARELLAIAAYDLLIQFPRSDYIVLQGKSSVRAPSSVWGFDIKKRVLSLVLGDQPGLQALFNPAARRGVAFIGDRSMRGGTFSLIDQTGAFTSKLAFLTLPSKCTFFSPVSGVSTSTSSQTKLPEQLGCAVPRDQEAFGRHPLPDDYQKRSFFTADAIYAVNTDTGTTKALFDDASLALDAINLKVFGDTLYFVNRYDQKLYAVPLK